MIRILIVDDEFHVRKRLSERIRWEQFGEVEVQCCDDGDLALEILEREMPSSPFSLILTDIRMPRMDGITMAREALSHWPSLKLLLMSAYDDKDYLKSALDLHAVCYLEKPLELSKVEQELKKVFQLLQRQEEARTSLETLRRQQQLELEHQLSQELCRAGAPLNDGRALPPSQLQQLRSSFPEFLTADAYCVILLQPCLEGALPLESSASGLETALRSFFRAQGFPCLLHTGQGNRQILLLALPDGKTCRDAALLLERLLSVQEQGRVFCSCGSTVSHLSQLPSSYQEAVITAERHFYHEETLLFAEERLPAPYEFSEQEQDSFAFALQKGNAAAAFQYLQTLRQTLSSHDTTLVRSTKNFYFRLALLLHTHPQENSSHYYLWELLYRIDSLRQLHEYLLELVTDHFPDTALQVKKGSLSSIKDYIHQHIQDPGLSLDEISRAHYMSVTWLCMYFKEQTGMTIKSYIIEYRMKQAASLLTHTQLKVAEIAELTGFSDQNYFTKRFSKYFDMTPSRYREQYQIHAEQRPQP